MEIGNPFSLWILRETCVCFYEITCQFKWGKKTKTKKKVVDKSSGSLTLVSYKKEDGLIEEKMEN